MRQVLRKREVYPILIIILERIRQKVAAKSRLKEQMARFARFFKAARFNFIFKRMVLKWRNKTLIPRPMNSTTEELTKWMDDRAKQHLKWLHSPSDDDDDDDEEGAFTIIAGDVPWKIRDVPSVAGARSKAFPASLVGRRTIRVCHVVVTNATYTTHQGVSNAITREYSSVVVCANVAGPCRSTASCAPQIC